MPLDPTYPSPDFVVQAETSTSAAPGMRIGRYEILDLLGRGGMGEVFRARDVDLGRRVAVKLLRSDLLGRTAETLMHEAQAMAKLSHPNVVVVYEVGAVEDEVYLAMEYVDGQTLRQWLGAAPRAWSEIVAAFVAAGRGLAAAHRAGIVHRDFKPDNVLVGSDGRVRVADFGLAGDAAPGDEPSDAAPADTMSFSVSAAGTPAYMSPEQHRRQAIDARSDQYSFCAALHEALYRRLPFAGRSIAELRESVLQHAIGAPPRAAAVPARLRAVVLRGLSLAPAARFATMDALVAELEAVLAGPRWSRLATAGAIAAAAALVVALFAVTRRDRGRDWRPEVRQLAPLFDEYSSGPIFSPDGRQIAYDSDRDGTWRIFLAPAEGGSDRAITPANASAGMPRFTRDGQGIMFRMAGGIYRAPLAGGPAMLVAPGGRFADDCGGGRLIIAYKHAAGCAACPSIAVRSADGSERERLHVDANEVLTDVICDRAGRRVAYRRGPRGGSQAVGAIWMMDLDGGEPVRLVAPGVDVHSPAFHPDGRSLLFSSARGGATNLWEIPLAGGPPVQITFGGGPDVTPDVSPDGRRVVFEVDTISIPLYAMPADGGAAERLTAGVEVIRSVDAARDGSELVLEVGLEGSAAKTHVVRFSLADRSQRIVAEGVKPIFSLDDREVIWADASASRLLAVARTGGEPHVVADLPGTVRSLAAAPDGQIYVQLLRGNRVEAWSAPLAGGVPIPVAPPAYVALVPAPAGGWRAAQVEGVRGAWLISPGGGSAQMLTGDNFSWERDGRALVYSRSGAVYRYDVASGKEVLLNHLPLNHPPSWLSTSADGKTIYYSAVQGRVRRNLVTNFGDRPRPPAP